MPRPIAKGTSRRPSIGDQNTEEAIRVLENRLAKVESESGVVQDFDEYDDTELLRHIDKIWHYLKSHRHRTETTEAGDTYEGPFKVTQTAGQDLQVTVSTGNVVAGLTTNSFAGDTENITSADDTYYLYLEINLEDTISIDLTHNATAPVQADDIERVLLAEIDVASAAITDIRQVQYGEIFTSQQPAVDVEYDGYFKVTKSDTLEVTVSAGMVIIDTTSTPFVGDTEIISSSTDTYYVYMEIDHSGPVTFSIENSSTYPVQTSTIERIVLAEVYVDGAEIVQIDQIHFGEIYSLRLSGLSGESYEGPFKVTHVSGNQISVSAGYVVTGTTTTLEAAQTHNLTGVTTTLYVYFEIYYLASAVVISLTHSSSYPVQGALSEKVVLAEVDLTSSVVTDIRQYQHGEIHSTRIWS